MYYASTMDTVYCEVLGSPCIWAGSIGTETSDARRLKTLAPAPT